MSERLAVAITTPPSPAPRAAGGASARRSSGSPVLQARGVPFQLTAGLVVPSSRMRALVDRTDQNARRLEINGSEGLSGQHGGDHLEPPLDGGAPAARRRLTRTQRREAPTSAGPSRPRRALS